MHQFTLKKIACKITKLCKLENIKCEAYMWGLMPHLSDTSMLFSNSCDVLIFSVVLNKLLVLWSGFITINIPFFPLIRQASIRALIGHVTLHLMNRKHRFALGDFRAWFSFCFIHWNLFFIRPCRWHFGQWLSRLSCMEEIWDISTIVHSAL